MDQFENLKSKNPANAAAAPARAVAGARDAKGETRTDAVTRELQQRLQTILYANEIATWNWDVRNNRFTADENLRRLFGVSRSEEVLTLERLMEAIHPEDRESVAAAVQSTVDGVTERYEKEYRIVRGDGSISWVIARGTVQRDEGGGLHFPGIIIDITNLRKSEQAARELHQRLEQQSRVFDTVLSSISDFAYIFDREGRFAYVNQALLDLWGLKLEEAVGKDFFDLKYPDELAARLQQQIQQVFDTGEGIRDETPYYSPTGAGGYYEYIFRPVLDPEGRVEVVAGSTRDITERKRVEEALRQSEEQLRTIAGTLELEVDIRTVELEERNHDVLKQSEQIRELSRSLLQAQDDERRHIARELHDSAGQLLVALAMNLNQLVYDAKRVDPQLARRAEDSEALVQQLVQEIRTASYLLHPPLIDEIGLASALSWYAEGVAERSGLQITLEIAKDLERPSSDVELVIFRLVQETLTNILRHSASKSAEIEVSRGQGEILLRIADHGKGIAPERMAEIESRGVGVGIRGMRERVRQFHGHMQIESSESGTTFLFSVPIPASDRGVREESAELP